MLKISQYTLSILQLSANTCLTIAYHATSDFTNRRTCQLTSALEEDRLKVLIRFKRGKKSDLGG